MQSCVQGTVFTLCLTVVTFAFHKYMAIQGVILLGLVVLTFLGGFIFLNKHFTLRFY